MKKLSTLTKAVAIAIGGLSFSGMATAGVINANMSRIPATNTSGDNVSTVVNNCGGNVEGWDGGINGVEPAATAKLKITQTQGTSIAQVSINGGVPNTVYTVWLRMKGNNLDDNGTTIGSFGGSPLTGGGATPLAPGSALDSMIEYSPFGTMPLGTPNPTNGFTTNANGNGQLNIALDFPVIGGAYPFNKASDAYVAMTPTGGPGTPTAIVNPSEPRVGGPFLIRLISHCQDNLGHGLSPAKREAWFQYP